MEEETAVVCAEKSELVGSSSNARCDPWITAGLIISCWPLALQECITSTPTRVAQPTLCWPTAASPLHQKRPAFILKTLRYDRIRSIDDVLLNKCSRIVIASSHCKDSGSATIQYPVFVFFLTNSTFLECSWWWGSYKNAFTAGTSTGKINTYHFR